MRGICIFNASRLPLQDYLCAMNSETGKWIIVAGMVIVVAGVLIYFFHDKLQWLGRLPGDIRIEKENFRFYFPVTSLILLSLLATVVIWIVRKVF